MTIKFLLVSLMVAVILIANPLAVAAAQQTKNPERIAISKLKEKLDSGEKFLLIDVREGPVCGLFASSLGSRHRHLLSPSPGWGYKKYNTRPLGRQAEIPHSSAGMS